MSFSKSLVVFESFSNAHTATLKSQATLKRLLKRRKPNFFKSPCVSTENLKQEMRGFANRFVAKVLCPPESCVRNRNVEN